MSPLAKVRPGYHTVPVRCAADAAICALHHLGVRQPHLGRHRRTHCQSQCSMPCGSPSGASNTGAQRDRLVHLVLGVRCARLLRLHGLQHHCTTPESGGLRTPHHRNALHRRIASTRERYIRVGMRSTRCGQHHGCAVGESTVMVDLRLLCRCEPRTVASPCRAWQRDEHAVDRTRPPGRRLPVAASRRLRAPA